TLDSIHQEVGDLARSTIAFIVSDRHPEEVDVLLGGYLLLIVSYSDLINRQRSQCLNRFDFSVQSFLDTFAKENEQKLNSFDKKFIDGLPDVDFSSIPPWALAQIFEFLPPKNPSPYQRMIVQDILPVVIDCLQDHERSEHIFSGDVVPGLARLLLACAPD